MGFPVQASLYNSRSVNVFNRSSGAAGAFLHQVALHKLVQVAVKHALGVGGGIAGPQVLDHLVRMKDVGADLRAPLDLLFRAFDLGLLLLTLLQLKVIEPRPEDAQGVLPVVLLEAGLRVLHDYS